MAEVDGGFEDEAEPTISIQEYLKDVEEQELEADLVLGGDDGKECTFSKGYLKRQAIFSCLTCTPDGNAGVCTACSLSCHDGHEIVELWTKRNFRCDCGNSKFGEFFCKLFPNKDTENVQNSYNHNFKGLYCTCGRPYPDPDLEDQVEMIQCCLCEDWFHEEHLGLDPSDEIPRDEEGEPLYEDFICQTCAASCSFLNRYPPTILSSKKQGGSTPSKNKGIMEEMPLADGSDKTVNGGLANNFHKMDNVTASDSSHRSCEENGISTGETSATGMGLADNQKESAAQNTCALATNAVDNPAVKDSEPIFLLKNWRDALCRCEKCMDMYSHKGIGFLLDKEDTIMEYEKVAKEKREEKLQQQEGVELSLLNNMGHVQKMEILNGIADMKDEIRTFLESFDSSKPITSADVHQVFENLAKKRRRD
ncbi:putative E3 ubiquitin-protein ligase UBR7 [Punica granatum]|uniref:E3 ubiquitin-protein ligase UBR7 n=2 Tax=Punica granatum TaxID=22663 RepID=A0A6P8DB81_PUNGR|nr:putative E3 ubiquitin-protein ligase UBR7 [Punica granatum]XP_031393885.1 putative E3 ubiquitin-protein ligase UBR7 [Punica granatum]PKI45322.1 hypothetical protein CRG98_034283 [Punica granatum]